MHNGCCCDGINDRHDTGRGCMGGLNDRILEIRISQSDHGELEWCIGASAATGLMWVTTWLTGVIKAIMRHRGGQCWRLMFGWLILMNTWYWNRVLLREWEFQSRNGVRIQLVDEQGGEWKHI